MLSELLHERAALYVSGAMTAPERENFELILRFHEELAEQVCALQELGTAVVLSRLTALPAVPGAVKDRLFGKLGVHPRETEPESVVVTDPAGLVEWVNPAFTAMCGYSLTELKGRKPGSLLQGPDTDAAAVNRIRSAARDHLPCREQLVNYHKNGSLYRIDIAIAPILDDAGEPLWFVATERQLRTAA